MERVHCAHLRSWEERLNALADQHRWNDALALAIEFYHVILQSSIFCSLSESSSWLTSTGEHFECERAYGH